MSKKQIFVGLILFVLGLLGVLSMLTMDIPLPEEAEAELKKYFTSGQMKLVLLINPTIMLLAATFVGTFLYKRANLSVPIIEILVGSKQKINVINILSYGAVGGILSGILLTLVSVLFNPILPTEFLELGESLKPTLAARFLYGGLTEEVLMRFGLMTFLVWVTSKIFKDLNPLVYWIGIILAALVFAVGHFPIAFHAVGTPSAMLLLYILIGNTIGGVIFGWLYWKKGLESAFIAHILAHVVMLMGEYFLN
jgi:hypothetical protein